MKERDIYDFPGTNRVLEINSEGAWHIGPGRGQVYVSPGVGQVIVHPSQGQVIILPPQWQVVGEKGGTGQVIVRQ